MTNPPGFFQGTEMPTAGWWEALFTDPAKIAGDLGVRPGLTIVDLCSGDGWFTLPIARIAARVWALDIDPGLHEVSRARLSENGISNVEYVTGDAFDLRVLVPAPVDLVFMANCFHGVPDKGGLATVIAQRLVAAGRFSVLNWHKRPREETPVLGEPRGPRTELRISPEETDTAVKAGGFDLERLVEVPPHHYGAIYKRTKSN